MDFRCKASKLQLSFQPDPDTSDAIGWFDAESQTSAPEQAVYNIQIGNFASDWNDGGLPKVRVSLIVNDKCPYL